MEQRFHEPEPPKATGEGVGVPRLEEAAPPPDAEKTTFILKSLVVEGATALPPDDLLPLWSGQLNTRISVKTLYDIAAAITARYTAAGYVLSQAVVPSQKIGSDGIARIQVIEGFVDQVVILGEADGVRDRLEEYADKIRASRPLRLAVLERYLLLASDLPGVSASGILKPSATTSGAADLVFQVARRPVEGFASLDNRGSRYIGPWQASSAVTLNSLLGRYDSTGIQVATSPFQPEELKYGYVAHEETIDSEGTKILADASYTVSHPGYTLADLALRSHAVTLGLGVSHPLIRTRAANLSVRCRVDGRDSRTDQDVSQPVSKDSIRAVRAGASLDWVDTVLVSPGVSLMAVEVSQGLDVLGARPTGSPDLSQANGHSDFVKATLDGSRTQALAPHTNLLVAFSGQLAGTSLLSSE